LSVERGYLFAFEGIDGAGKSSCLKTLGDRLTSLRYPVVLLREPTNGIYGKKIREILIKGREGISPEEELLLFINDRKENVERNISPALNDNKIVLIDRYYYSTAAYQGALGLDPKKICLDNEKFAPRPDRVFLFKAPVTLCLERIGKNRSGGPDAFEKQDYLSKVQSIFDQFTGDHFRRIDSSLPFEEVVSKLVEELKEFFPNLNGS
jgi:dTMP kinase